MIHTFYVGRYKFYVEHFVKLLELPYLIQFHHRKNISDGTSQKKKRPKKFLGRSQQINAYSAFLDVCENTCAKRPKKYTKREHG